jgi:Ca-activated chloride channel family protein
MTTLLSRYRSVRRARLALAIALLAASFGTLGADSVRITQIDTSNLLLGQEVNLYLDASTDSGTAIADLTPEMLTVWESSDGENYRKAPGIRGLRTQPNLTEGINFLLLVDNSGSMYDSLSDTPTEDPSRMKITAAKRALTSFLSSVTNPKDTIGLVAFNTQYTLLSSPRESNRDLRTVLDGITRPETENAYTELYASMFLAAEFMSDLPGRKVLIVLSDGENYPYTVRTGRPHPRLGTRVYEYTESIDKALREGVTIFAIRFGNIRDIHLEDVARETGGLVFDAANEQELSDVYLEIRNRVLREYLLSYTATMIPADRKYVRVELSRAGAAPAWDTRYYYSSVIFGLPLANLSWLLFIPFTLALAMWFILTRLKYEHASTRAMLEVIQPGEGKPSARTIPLGTKKTVIGGSPKADLTIVGSPTIRQEHATVVYDEGSDTYTVVGEGEIKVNNRNVQSRTLEPGDVINVGGTTIVFDTSETGEQGEPERKEKT